MNAVGFVANDCVFSEASRSQSIDLLIVLFLVQVGAALAVSDVMA